LVPECIQNPHRQRTELEADVEFGLIPVYCSGGAASMRPSYYREFRVSMQLPGFRKNLNKHCRRIAPCSDFLFEQSLVFETEIFTNYLIA